LSVALPDVNLLLAMFWSKHDFHARAMTWFKSTGKSGWATCPFTQAGFVRIISNKKSYPFGPTPKEAIDLLSVSTAGDTNHRFWPGDLAISEWSTGLRSRIQGHRQITDAYLLALAARYEGALVTFDEGILQLAPVGSVERSALVLLH
jgi:uncharacterized protein